MLVTLRKAPILRCLMAIIIGIAVHELLPPIVFYVALALLLLALLATHLFVLKPRPRYSFLPSVLIMSSYVAFGASYAQLFDTELIPDEGRCKMTGHVADIIRTDSVRSRIVFYADTLDVHGQCYYNRKGILDIRTNATDLRIGDVLQIDGLVYGQHAEPFAFDYVAYLQNNHYEFDSRCYTIVRTGERHISLASELARLRHYLIARLGENGISPQNLNLLQALFLGDKSQLDRATQRAFSDCGVIHILAVSGLHVGIIFVVVSFIFGKVLKLGKRTACLATLACLWFYAVLAGLSPPIFRATIMMSTCTIARSVGQKYSIYNTLCLAMLVILLCDPTSLYSVGMWLSFCAVAGLVTFHPHLMRLCPSGNKVVKYVYESLTVSLVAQMSTLPIILHFFQTFPNYFLVNNFVVLPLVMPIIAGAILTLVFSAVPYVGWAFGWATDKIIWFITAYAKEAAQWSGAVTTNISLDKVEVVLMSVTIVALGYSLFLRTRKSRLVFGTCLSAFCIYSIAAETTILNSSQVGIFTVSGYQNVVVSEAGQATFYLSDTTHLRTLAAVDDICCKWRIDEREVRPLENGMELIFCDKRFLVGEYDISTLPDDSLENIGILVGHEVPNQENLLPQYVVQSKHTWHDVWQRWASTEELDIESGSIIWSDYFDGWLQTKIVY